MAAPDDLVPMYVRRRTREAIKSAAKKCDTFDDAVRHFCKNGGLDIPAAS